MDVNSSPTLQASSAVRKSGISITLPRNFAPLSLDASSHEPRTPDQTFAEMILPPPPPHSTYRIRRPRLNLDSFQSRNNALPATLFASGPCMPSSTSLSRVDSSLPSSIFNSDEPVPSIETPTALRPGLTTSSSEPLFSAGLSVPIFPPVPPRTPPAQTNMTTPEIKRSKWEMHRAASVSSHHSDSSLSSSGTFATRPTSFDGSATSPDCDNQDPFSPPVHVVKVTPDTPTRQVKWRRQQLSLSKDNVTWSIDMDNHLFNVYQIYLADPTVTPFKTVPGSIPPTGVCHRVARRAKETWPRASRIDVPIIKRYKMRNFLDVRRPVRDKTPEPEDFLQTDETRPLWPSESSTRKRLKQLCREKFTISAHYQRLRESRSPSPFADQFTRRSTSRPTRSVSPAFPSSDLAGSYSTRELGISLVASDASAPLARVMAEETLAQPPVQPSQDWFGQPLNAPEPMVLSTPLSLDSAPHVPEPQKLAPAAAKIPRLASPFNYSTWNGPTNRNPHRRHISHSQFETIHATGSRLLSPFRPDQDMSFKMHKRRAQHQLEDELSPSGSNLGSQSTEMTLDENAPMSGVAPPQDLKQDFIFSGAGDIGQRRIRLRNRGVSLGAHANGVDRIGRFINQPTALSNDIPPVPPLPAFLSNFAAPSKPMGSTLTLPEVDPTQKRLGSPFELDPNKRSLRSRSPRHAPSMSDPFISTSQFSMAPLSSGITHLHQHNSSIGGISERLALFGDLHRQDESTYEQQRMQYH